MVGQVAAALSVLCLKRIPRGDELLNSAQLTAASIGIAALFCVLALPLLNAVAGAGTPLARFSGRQYLWLVLSGVFLGGFEVLFVAAVGRTSTLLVALSPAAYTALLIALSFLLLPGRPRVTWEFWAASSLIVVGFVWLAVRYQSVL
jgi:drug/metabolite transporter (DMT)-like permease